MNFRNEKGSITVYVLVAVFFLLAIIAGRFVIANRNLKVQYNALAKVKAIYESGDKQYPVEGGGTNPDVPDLTGPVDHEIYIFNGDAFKFFNNPSGRFYVYQVDIWYISDASQSRNETKDREISLKDTENYNFKYKLMSDITVDDIIRMSWSYTIDTTKYPLCQNQKLDFNNHIIYAKETEEEDFWGWGYTYYENYVFSNNGRPAIGQTEK